MEVRKRSNELMGKATGQLHLITTDSTWDWAKDNPSSGLLLKQTIQTYDMHESAFAKQFFPAEEPKALKKTTDADTFGTDVERIIALTADLDAVERVWSKNASRHIAPDLSLASKKRSRPSK